MITQLGVAGVFVTDYDEAKEFFVGKLGFEERHDVVMDNGFRWLTVGPPASPAIQLHISVPGPPTHDDATAAMLRELMAKGVLSAGAWNTDDCRATYELYRSRGVEFIQEPHERPYGVEAVFRDPFGNWYSLNETNEQAFDRQAMEKSYSPAS